jgi:hypothetical protein
MGPILVGQLLLLNQESAFTISWLGIATIVSGLIFAYYNKTLRLRSLKKIISMMLTRGISKDLSQ